MIHQRAVQLDKSSKKYSCPNCHKKTFVLYLQPDKKMISDRVGRCDREDNCGYHYTPRQYYRDSGIYNKQVSGNYRYIKGNQPQPNNRGDYIPLNYIYQRAETRNSNFVYFLFELFDWQTIRNTVDPYFIGCTTDRQTVFPQIDEKGKCRTAKIQQYDRHTGKRVKEAVNWIHAILKKEKKISENFNLQMCLFGLHLIRSKKNEGKTICICESEKSAIFAAGFLPQYLWMAVGALGWLNIEKLKPLKGWNVILFPDTSANGKAFEKWSYIAKQAQNIGLKVTVSTLLEDRCTVKQKQIGYDIGDFLVDNARLMLDTDTIKGKPSVIDQMTVRFPAFDLLITTFDLQVIGISSVNTCSI